MFSACLPKNNSISEKIDLWGYYDNIARITYKSTSYYKINFVQSNKIINAKFLQDISVAKLAVSPLSKKWGFLYSQVLTYSFVYRVDDPRPGDQLN